MKRIEISVVIGIIAAVIMGSFTGFGAQCDDVRQGLVRLHILANSDSAEDQALKLKVRDALLASSVDLFENAMTKSEAEKKISANLDEIKNIAEKEIALRGYDYPVQVEAVNMYFETREYGEFTVPAGRYDAVRVLIGGGAGKNWWCVMFPPMCVPAASENKGLPLEDEIKELGSQPHYKPKFAVVELIEDIRNKFHGGTDEAWETDVK